MKTLIKTSFVLALMAGFLAFGLNNAYAKNKKAKPNNRTIKTTEVTIPNVAPTPCEMQAMEKLPLVLNKGYQSNVNLIAYLMLTAHCEPATYINGDYMIVVSKDCTVTRFHRKVLHKG